MLFRYDEDVNEFFNNAHDSITISNKIERFDRKQIAKKFIEIISDV